MATRKIKTLAEAKKLIEKLNKEIARLQVALNKKGESQ